MTKNMIDALRLQEEKRHNKVSEITTPITNAIGAVGSVLRGVSGFAKPKAVSRAGKSVFKNIIKGGNHTWTK